MRGSSAAANVVTVPPPEMPMHPTRRASSSLAGFDPVDGAHHVINAPSDHGLAEQQRRAGGRLASGGLRAFLARDRIAAAAEGQRFDGYGGHAVLHHLDCEIVLIAGLVRAVAALGVDAHDIVHAAPVAGQADHGGMRRRGIARRQQVAEHQQARPAFKDELLAAIGGETRAFRGSAVAARRVAREIRPPVR
jgi:hypothetical protein